MKRSLSESAANVSFKCGSVKTDATVLACRTNFKHGCALYCTSCWLLNTLLSIFSVLPETGHEEHRTPVPLAVRNPSPRRSSGGGLQFEGNSRIADRVAAIRAQRKGNLSPRTSPSQIPSPQPSPTPILTSDPSQDTQPALPELKRPSRADKVCSSPKASEPLE